MPTSHHPSCDRNLLLHIRDLPAPSPSAPPLTTSITPAGQHGGARPAPSPSLPTSHHLCYSSQANTAEACQRACEVETEIMCRSFLYHGPPTGNAYNCQLFHLDHVTLPDGALTFLSADRPLIDTGRQPGTYYENVCRSEYRPSPPTGP